MPYLRLPSQISPGLIVLFISFYSYSVNGCIQPAMSNKNEDATQYKIGPGLAVSI